MSLLYSITGRIRSWLLGDWEARTQVLERQISEIRQAVRELAQQRPPSSRATVYSAIGTVTTAVVSLVMLFTVNLQSCRQAERDIHAKEIEYTARAKIDLVGNVSNVCFQAINYGKIPIEKGGFFIRFVEVKGTSVEIVTNSYSDFGRTHPDDPQSVIVKNPLKPAPVSGPPEPPFGFALAIFCGEQTFMETRPFVSETVVWFFEKRLKWTKEAESLGNVDEPEKTALKKAISDFSNEIQANLRRRMP